MGKPATRLTDMTAHGGTIVGPGVPTVMIGKMPTATILDQHVCPMVTGVVPHVGGPSTLGSMGVFIGKKPAGRIGDLHVCVGPPSMPVMGCFTVLIGEAGGGGGGSAGAAASAAAASIKGPASIEPFPLAEAPPATEIHYSQFKFIDSAGKGLGGIPYLYTGPDKTERKGCSAPGGEVFYSGLPKSGSYKVKAGALSDAKWSKTKAALAEELELTAKADGFPDGTPAILSILERSSNGLQRFLHSEHCKVEGKKIKTKWKVDLGADDTEAPPADKSARAEFYYQFIAYAEGGVAVSDKLLIETDLEVEILDEIAQPIVNKPVEVLLTNGEVKTGKLDANGKFKVGKVPAKPAMVRLAVPGVYRGSLKGGIFDPGKCFVISASTNFLTFQEIVKFAMEHPDFNLLVVGHTDRAGNTKLNLDLSKARAEAVVAFLKDDVTAWEANYGSSKPPKIRWGILEDKHMLKALHDGGTPFLAGRADNKADRNYFAAVKRFQAWSNAMGTKLPTTGKIDLATRKELIKNYMASDGMSLPASVNVTVHGCGESHNLHSTADGVPDSVNRRVELYFFEGDITPPPVANCPTGGCAEWIKWHSATTNLLKINPGTSGGIQRDEYSQAFLDCFKDLDKDSNGSVSMQEIYEALDSSVFKGEHAAMVAATKSIFHTEFGSTASSLTDLSDDSPGKADEGISLLDIDLLDKLRVSNPTNKLVTTISSYYFYAKKKIANQDSAPFNGGLKPYIIKQGLVGDCSFLSVLICLAASPGRSTEITKMIKPIGAGKYEVTFPGHPNVITITKPTDSEIGLYSSTNMNGLWVTILEKAFATQIATKLYSRPNRSLEALDQGVWPYDSIKILTGHDYDQDDIWATRNSTLRTKMISAFACGKIVAADIMPNLLHSESETRDGLARKHAYSVLGYNSSTDRVKIRNPWGFITFRGTPDPTGIIEIPMSSFDENFTHIYFEQ